LKELWVYGILEHYFLCTVFSHCIHLLALKWALTSISGFRPLWISRNHDGYFRSFKQLRAIRAGQQAAMWIIMQLAVPLRPLIPRACMHTWMQLFLVRHISLLGALRYFHPVEIHVWVHVLILMRKYCKMYMHVYVYVHVPVLILLYIQCSSLRLMHPMKLHVWIWV
jgi:hypothetical protein